MPFDDECKHKKGDVYQGLGEVLRNLGLFKESEKYFKLAMEIYMYFSNKPYQAQTYFNLGNVSFNFKDYESSKSYFQKALEIFIEFKDKHAIAKVLRNARTLADVSGDEGVLKEMVEMLAAHFSKEEINEFLNSPPDS